MNIFSEVINSDNLLKASGVISICALVYYSSHWIYDFITKSDIEKCLTYRGKDRITLGVSAFILNAILVVMTTFEQLIESKDESDLVY
ncbi:hypothetical protein J14TS2_52230 [Bacillus sp. J14TS2]|uniref:hypothetical protein n=1 Tax=Bacillus sp. J14TS2 TaxID=2807188 RepID=UPI001B231EBA|nr:hypothetical protein [Bacillus sp. J14TS2]GIN74748.1 hypothetical protein J14TS2_52230 [Bacillus sp. J14TS2]